MAHSSPIPHEQDKVLKVLPKDRPIGCMTIHAGVWQNALLPRPHFSKVRPFCRKFLLFVVAETIEGRENEIGEHQIGVHVFDRRSGYSTVEDNIVRNYARQLRKRLADHFANQGNSERFCVSLFRTVAISQRSSGQRSQRRSR